VSFRNNAHADIEANHYFGNDWETYDFLHVTDSNFEGNTAGRAVISYMFYDEGMTHNRSGAVLLRNNWYGDASGPTTTSNPGGTGEQLIGEFELDGWSAIPFSSACTTDCFSSVLFLPGLEASRLYDDQNSSCVADKVDPTRIWEPSCNNDARKLYLDASGKSIDPDIHTKEGDVLDETPTGANIYQSFLEELERMKNTDHLINDWQAVAYDWRLSLDDILDDGTVAQRLRELAGTSKSGKVTIVAHSNGGLLAKALMQKIGDTEVGNLVDKIVFVAVPQVGTPAAVAGLLHGYKQNFFPVLDTPTARGLAENMPGAYQLLPTAQYFSSVETPVATFDTDGSSDWHQRYADTVDSQGELYDFLSDTFRRVTATNTDTETLADLNETLLNHAEQLHDDLDTWVAPAGVRLVQIAGWGVPSTLSSTEYTPERRELCDELLCQSNIELLEPKHKFTIDGDGTVVTPSALWMKDVERYWVDIGKWNKDHPFSTALGVFAREHSSFLEIPEVRILINNVVRNEIDDQPYIYNHVPDIEGNLKRLQYSLHSPLTLSLYDDEGRHTGISPTGEIEEQIPGTYYKQFGEVKYIFADAGSAGHIVLDGYETGDFTFVVEEFEGDTSLGKVTFQDMPTTPETRVTFDVPSDLASVSHLRIDRDGDGTTDIDLAPKIGEIVTYDTTAPVTTAVVTGIQGANGWHASDVTVTLTVTDEGSGVEQAGYSLDGTTWHVYGGPITLSTEGTTTLSYFSIDQAGNQEEKKTETIRIDKTAPEGKISFNPMTQKLDITGTDNLGGAVTVVIVEQKKDLVATNTNLNKIKPWFDRWLKQHKKNLPDMLATLTDEAGHTTSISFEKTKDRQGYVFVRVRSLGYDDNETVLTEALAQYQWQIDRSAKYRKLASSLKTGSTRLETRYIPWTDETWIMERPQDLGDAERDDESERRPVKQKLPGLVVPYLLTKQGIVDIKY
jgi:pimeloyl-ACP methyl ester carboxylesterase